MQRWLSCGLAAACCANPAWSQERESKSVPEKRQREVIILDLGSSKVAFEPSESEEHAETPAETPAQESALPGQRHGESTEAPEWAPLEEGALPAPKFMLGLGLSAVGPQLREYLDIEGGLYVERVVEGSPADQAGIHVGDVLLSYQDEAVGDIGSLMKRVDELGASEAAVVVRRKDDELTLQIQPVEREPKPIVAENAERSEEGSKILELLKQLDVKNPDDLGALEERLKALGNGEGLDVLKLGPAITLQGEQPADGHSLSITIDLDNGEQPVIRLERDGQKWEATPEKIEEMGEALGSMIESAIEPYVTTLEGLGEGRIKITARVEEGQGHEHPEHAEGHSAAEAVAEQIARKGELKAEAGHDGKVRILVPGLMGQQAIEVPIPQVDLDFVLPDMDVDSLIPGKVLMLRSSGEADLSKQIQSLRNEIESLKQQLQLAEEKLPKE
jgi:hypothetical protein